MKKLMTSIQKRIKHILYAIIILNLSGCLLPWILVGVGEANQKAKFRKIGAEMESNIEYEKKNHPERYKAGKECGPISQNYYRTQIKLRHLNANRVGELADLDDEVEKMYDDCMRKKGFPLE